MTRALFVAIALSLSAPALACGGDKPCNKSHCKMQSQDEVAAAMAEVEAAEGTKVALSVTGMSCGQCAKTITAALQELDGVNAAAVSHAEGVARVAYDPARTDLDKIIAAVNAIGKFKAEKAES